MLELLALPGWDTPLTLLTHWVDAIRQLGQEAEAVRESTGVSWLEIRALRCRGYSVMQGSHVEAINFELGPPHEAAARDLLERAARAIGWELHDDDGDEDPDDDTD